MEFPFNDREYTSGYRAYLAKPDVHRSEVVQHLQNKLQAREQKNAALALKREAQLENIEQDHHSMSFCSVNACVVTLRQSMICTVVQAMRMRQFVRRRRKLRSSRSSWLPRALNCPRRAASTSILR
jgi:hypothetical protein